jgi:hypothetical protein
LERALEIVTGRKVKISAAQVNARRAWNMPTLGMIVQSYSQKTVERHHGKQTSQLPIRFGK